MNNNCVVVVTTHLSLALQELNKKMADYWKQLAPLPQSALDTIADGAYYTTLIQDKLRVLSFNSDYGSGDTASYRTCRYGVL